MKRTWDIQNFFRGLLMAAAVCVLVCLPVRAEKLPTVCPAIESMERERTNNPFVSREPPTLAVFGKISSVSEEGRGEPRYSCHIEIEQVLLGHWPAKTMEFSSEWKAEGQKVFFLAPASYAGGPDFQLRYTMDSEDLGAAKALCSARLDTIALGAESIFIGEETGNPDYDYREIKVLGHVSGQQFGKGEKLRVAIHTAMKSREPARAQPGARIYFVGSVHKRRPDDRGIYPGFCALPVEVEPAVREAIKRRESYPVIDAPKWMDVPKAREVTFRGDVAGALRLLDAREEAARLLGQRYLFHHAEDSRGRLIAEIAAAMFQTGTAKDREFALQKTRIETLAHLEHNAATGALATLAERMIAKLEADPAAVPMPERDENKVTQWTREGRVRMAEERTTDVNHSMTWLLSQMPETEVARRWDERLISLRARLDGWWKHEVTLAIEATRIEGNRELAAAMARMAGIKPVRSAAEFRHPQDRYLSAVAFSPDGAFLASSGGDIRIWRTSDWKLESTIPRGTSHLLFSPDGKFLYCGGGEQGDVNFSRYEWRTGRLDRSYRDPDRSLANERFLSLHHMRLSKDGEFMMTQNYGLGSIMWETRTGKTIRTSFAPSVSAAPSLMIDGSVRPAPAQARLASDDFFMSEDGKRIARLVKAGEMYRHETSESIIESADGKNLLLNIPNDFKPDCYAFTPDGRYFLSFGSADSTGLVGNVRLAVHDLESAGAKVSSVTTPGHFASSIVVSPDGKFVAACDQGSQVWLYALPELKPVWAANYGDSHSVHGIAFSPDGKLLAIAGSQPAPRLLRMDTFEEIMPHEGHSGGIRAAYISKDNQRVWSFGRDGSLCHWDAATMKLTQRFPILDGYDLASIRPPDGKYAVFIARKLPQGRDRQERKIKVIAAETGEAVWSTEIKEVEYPQFHWPATGGLLMVDNHTYYGPTLMLADFLDGKIVSHVTSQQKTWLNAPFFLSHDRKSLLANAGTRPTEKSSDRMDLSTGTITRLVSTGTGTSRQADGVIHELLSEEHEPKMLPQVRGIEILRSTLSADGKRLAVVTGARIFIDENLRQWDPQTPSVIRIHDADSLEMVCAFPASTRWVNLRFNADGSQLAVSNDDGTIERWALPR